MMMRMSITTIRMGMGMGMGHDHDHDHADPHGQVIDLGQAVLKKNDERAARNRAWFAGREILALNLVSSPGAGKTTLLERTIREHAAREAATKRDFYVTEGEDKPVKYPHMFQATDMVIVNKIDLLPHLDFDIELCIGNIARVNPNAKILKLSAKSAAFPAIGEGKIFPAMSFCDLHFAMDLGMGQQCENQGSSDHIAHQCRQDEAEDDKVQIGLSVQP